MDDERVVVALLAALMLAGVVGELYSPAEVYYCPAAQPCTAQEGLPAPMPHGPEAESWNGARPYTFVALSATGSTSAGPTGTFGVSGSFGAKGQTGPTGGADPQAWHGANGPAPPSRGQCMGVGE
jgi:hypothetical protein